MCDKTFVQTGFEGSWGKEEAVKGPVIRCYHNLRAPMTHTFGYVDELSDWVRQVCMAQ